MLHTCVHSQFGIGCHIGFLVLSIGLMTLLIVQACVTEYRDQPTWYYVMQVLILLARGQLFNSVFLRGSSMA
jgi:hypothetical protein